MSLVVKSCADCPFLPKIKITANYAGVSVKHEVVEKGKQGFELGHPLRKCPVAEADGCVLFESNAIARYVAAGNPSAKLLGTSPYETAEIDGWISIATNDVERPISTWAGIVSGKIPNDENTLKKAIADSRKVLQSLDSYLLTRTFLVRDRLTLADIVVAAALVEGYKTLFDLGFRKAFKNTNRWFLTCINQPNFASVLGQVALCDKKPVAPAAAAPAAAAPAPVKEQKKEQPKQEQEEDDTPAPTESKKKPFSDLPPSPFNMIEFKVTYSNEDFRTVALPYFYEHYDKSGWCLWFAEYKYPEELQKLFMVNNLLGGFFQRAEIIRDFTVGSFHIFGEENNYAIIGSFLLRGTEWPADVMSEIPDVDSYNFRKVDLDNADDKAMFEDLWGWDGKLIENGFKGLPYAQSGKVMK